MFFDVWVIGPAPPSQEDSKERALLLKRIEVLHPVAARDGEQFVGGGRLRLRRGIAQDVARRIVAELEALGASAEVEANRPPDEEILALDQFQDAEPELDGGPAVDESLLAQLQSLDGDGEPGAATLELDEPIVTGGAKPKAPTPPPAPVVDEERFRPSGDWQQPMELQLERPVRPHAPPPPPPGADDDPSAPPPDDARGAAPAAAATTDWQPVPGRLANGALRKNAAVRIAIGVVLGLGLGWMFAQPYAHRAERRVADLRARADAERYRPVDEAQARVRALDREADDSASSSAFGMAVIWVLVGGAAFAGWWRAT